MDVKVAKSAKMLTGVKQIAAKLEKKCIDKTQFIAPFMDIPVSNIKIEP